MAYNSHYYWWSKLFNINKNSRLIYEICNCCEVSHQNLNFKLNILEEVPSYIKYNLFRISLGDVIDSCVECAIKDVILINTKDFVANIFLRNVFHSGKKIFISYPEEKFQPWYNCVLICYAQEHVPYSVSNVFLCWCRCPCFPVSSLMAFVFFLFLERLAPVNEALLPKHLKSLLFLASQESQINGL